jgi:hypothetical protein
MVAMGNLVRCAGQVGSLWVGSIHNSSYSGLIAVFFRRRSVVGWNPASNTEGERKSSPDTTRGGASECI